MHSYACAVAVERVHLRNFSQFEFFAKIVQHILQEKILPHCAGDLPTNHNNVPYFGIVSRNARVFAVTFRSNELYS